MKKFKVVEKKNIEDLNIDELRELYSNLQVKLLMARKKVGDFGSATDTAIMMSSIYSILSIVYVAIKSLTNQPLGNLDLMSMATFSGAMVSAACATKLVGHKALDKKVNDLMDDYTNCKKELEAQEKAEHERKSLEQYYHELKDLLERLNGKITIDGGKDYTRANIWTKLLTEKIDENTKRESFGSPIVNSSVINYEGVQQFFRYMLSKAEPFTMIDIHSVSYDSITFEFSGLSSNGALVFSGIHTIGICDNEPGIDYAYIFLPGGRTIYLTKDGKISKITDCVYGTSIKVENDLYKDVPPVRTQNK